MEQTDIIMFLGIGTALAWGALYAWMEDEGKKKLYVIYAGILIDAILFAVSWDYVALLGGVITGILLGSIKGGFDYLFRRIGIQDNHKMHGWKNWVILSVNIFVMMYLTIAIVMKVQ